MSILKNQIRRYKTLIFTTRPVPRKNLRMLISDEMTRQNQQDTILIVDDNPANLDILLNHLNKTGYRLLVAEDGESALKRAKLAHPDIILLDVVMPGTDGFEICCRLKTDVATKDIPIIFITALSDTAHKIRGFQAGGVDYITKPIQKEEVLARISTHLRIWRLQKQLQEKNRRLKREITVRKKAEKEIQKQNRLIQENEKKLKAAKESLEIINQHLETRIQEAIRKCRQQQEILIQRSKLESLGKLAAGIAHEINQPLAGISMGLDNILLKLSSGKATDEYLKNKFSMLLGHIDRINHIISHVRTFSREQASALIGKTDLREVSQNAISMVQAQYQHRGIRIELHSSCEDRIVMANKYKLEQVLLNLISNAKDAVEEKARCGGDASYQKKIEIRISCDTDKVCLEIQDNGIGIAPEDIGNIFDPFFTTKDPEHGTGLGLSVSYGIIKELKGNITVQSESGEYTRMKIDMPGVSVNYTKEGI